MAEWSSNSLSFPFGEPLPTPPAPQPQPFTALSPFLLPPSLLPALAQFGWGGRGRPKTAGPVSPIRLSTGAGLSSHWVADGRPSSLKLPSSYTGRPPPILPCPIHPKGSTKNATNLALGLCSYSECSNLLLLLTNTQSQLKILDIQHN